LQQRKLSLGLIVVIVLPLPIPLNHLTWKVSSLRNTDTPCGNLAIWQSLRPVADKPDWEIQGGMLLTWQTKNNKTK